MELQRDSQLLDQRLDEMGERISVRRRRAEELREMVESLEAEALREEQLLAELRGALGLAPQLQIEELSEVLRGERLRQVAVETLQASGRGDVPIHYREWYDLLRAAGKQASGKAPLSTFLNQINRAPEVEPVGGRSGLYLLRAA